jgi:glutamyl-tRNA synthetase
MKKLEAINGDKIRALTPEVFLEKSLPFLKDAKVLTGTHDELDLLKKALPIIQERVATLAEVPAMLKFLFVKEFVVDADSMPKVSDDESKKLLTVAFDRLQSVTSWTHDGIEAVLRTALIEEMGLKPRIAFSAVRIAVTGSHISPPLFESMELLGREVSLARIKSLI